MAKQLIYDTRGATYGAGVAIKWDTFQIPPLIKEIEAKKKIELKIDCPWPGCYKTGHKTNRSKLCKYWDTTNDNSFVTALEIYLKFVYPDQYGTSQSHDADDVSHLMVPTMLFQYDLIVFGGVYRFDVCLLWEIILKKSDFLLRFFALRSSLWIEFLKINLLWNNDWSTIFIREPLLCS